MTAGRSGATSERLKVGIVGGGAITQVAHLPVLKKMRSVEVAGYLRHRPAQGPGAGRPLRHQGRVRRHRGAAALRGPRRRGDLLAQPPARVPHPGRALGQSARAGGEAARHVGRRARSGSSGRSEKHDRVVMVGMNHRYRPDVQIVRSFVQSGELGTIESVRGSWHVFRPGRTQLGWRQRRDQAGGGAMLDLGLSILDLGLWLGGSSAAGAGQRQPRSEREGAAPWSSRAAHSSSARTACRSSSTSPGATWGKGSASASGVRGSKGTAGINPLNVWKELHGVAVDVSPTGSVSRENAFTASYRAEWAHFQAAIAGEAKVPGAAGASDAAQGDGRDLPLGARRPRRGVVRRGGGTAVRGGSLARVVTCCGLPLLLLSSDVLRQQAAVPPYRRTARPRLRASPST